MKFWIICVCESQYSKIVSCFFFSTLHDKPFAETTILKNGHYLGCSLPGSCVDRKLIAAILNKRARVVHNEIFQLLVPYDPGFKRYNWHTPSSMEFHGIPSNCSGHRNWHTPSSMEFYGILLNCSCHWNRMAWQWAEAVVEIRETLADNSGTTKQGSRYNFSIH